MRTSSITASTCCRISANTGWPTVWQMAASSWLPAGSSASASAGSSTSTSRSRIMLLTSEEMRLQKYQLSTQICRRHCRSGNELHVGYLLASNVAGPCGSGTPDGICVGLDWPQGEAAANSAQVVTGTSGHPVGAQSWHVRLVAGLMQQDLPHLSRSLGSLERHSSTLCAMSSLARSSSTQSRRSLRYTGIAHQQTKGGGGVD